MSTLSSGLDFPHDTNSMEAQNIFSEIEEFLDKIFPDQQNQDYTLNLYAESLSGFVRREEFYIHTGSGGNGKSLNADLLSHVFGEYYYAPDSTIFNTPKSDPNAPNPIIANARGKRIVMTTEPKQERGLQADIIKQYSGCDPITGRHLNKEPITFKPSCKWNMQCNDIPELDSTDEGIMRRVCVIPYPSKFVSSDSPKLKNPDKFPNHFPKDPTIKEKLPTWAPYFLAMLWQRYLKLKHSYFMDLSETRRPEAVNEATTNYKKESSVYASFYEDKMEEKLGYRQNLNEVFNRFKDHLRDSESMKKVDRKAFETQMKRFLNIRIENKIKWVYDCVIMGQGEEYNS
jgi:P4 family phage/plasmid primase-like protien